ncbi:hypothetical protein AB0K36_21015 [Streptomyces kurssanovii]|uniref:Excisionase n=1 Tax=Streptomyces kurssanovii TaxID=67312 RepID=A0ABV3HXE2_9ACTN
MHDDELPTVPASRSAAALYDLLRTRRLASLTIGRARRIPAHALTDYVQRQRPPDDRSQAQEGPRQRRGHRLPA